MSKLERFRLLAQEVFTSASAEHEHPRAQDLKANALAGTSHLKGARLISLDRILADPHQPRKTFSAQTLGELAASIKTHGVLQPLLVEYDRDQDVYKIVTGERRYRAAKIAGLPELPCVVCQQLDPKGRLYYRLVENLQREDITPFEEADAFLLLAQEFQLKHQEIAHLIGKSRSYVSKTIKLALIPADLRDLCAANRVLTREHLIALSQQPDRSEMSALLQKIVAVRTPVRSLRQLKQGKQQRRRAQFEFRFAPEDNRFSVTVRFRKRTPKKDEIAFALRSALHWLGSQANQT